MCRYSYVFVCSVLCSIVFVIYGYLVLCLVFFFFYCFGSPRDLPVRTHSFPTRRSSDLGAAGAVPRCDDLAAPGGAQACRCAWPDGGAGREDAGVSGLAVRHEWSELDEAQRAATLARPARTVSRELREGVAAILDQVRARGDAALRELTLRLDGADLEDLFVDKREFALAEFAVAPALRSEEHTSELQSLMRISYAVFCLKKK